MDDSQKPDDRPIEDVLEDIAAEVPAEDWDRVPPSDFGALTAWEELKASEDRRPGDPLLNWACVLIVAGGLGIVIVAIAKVIVRWWTG